MLRIFYPRYSQLRSGRVAFLRMNVLSAVPMVRSGFAEAMVRMHVGRAAVLRREAMVSVTM